MNVILTFSHASLGTNISTKEEVAIKLEDVTSKHPQLHIESKFYRVMSGGSKCLSPTSDAYFDI